MKGKQKVYLRKLAQTIKAVFQIGKEGLTENIEKAILDYLRKNELMKVSILQNCDEDAKKIIDKLEAIDVCVVQHIGSVLVLYKENIELEKRIVLPE